MAMEPLDLYYASSRLAASIAVAASRTTQETAPSRAHVSDKDVVVRMRS